jgi:hypothetical protein
MNKKQILQQLDNPTLDDHERERLQQLLHYMTVEGVNTTTTRGANNGSRTKSSTPKTTHTRTKKSIRTHNKP